jgi:hypothetical protein
VTATNRKTGFIGFLVAIQAVTVIFQEYVVGSHNSTPPLKYLLTHKLSQDHLEQCFGCIRSHNRWNNNLTARQFATVYKRLIVQHEIKVTTGNCICPKLIR